MERFRFGRAYRRLNAMVDEAINGTFTEGDYDESELSRLEVKWKRYLAASAMSRQNVKREREVLQSLVSDISHQTKTPLSNIKLYAELLQERPLDADSRRLAEKLGEQTGRLEFLIQSLVKMSRLETGTILVEPRLLKVRALVSAAAAQAEEKAREKGIRLEISGEESAAAYYDAKWTGEALYNVLDNAVKYSPPKSVVEISWVEYELFTCIRVRDEGIGITEEEAAQLFSRFYRSPRTQQEEGVGLGLYLTRQILSASGGFIKAASLAKGSEFSLYLPREGV